MLPIAIFTAMCIALMSRRALAVLGGLDRASVVWVAACLMVAASGVAFEDVLRAISLDVIVLLFAMSLIAGYLMEARFFRWAATIALTRTGSAERLVFYVAGLAGALSAWFMNDTIAIVFTPLVVAIVAQSNLPPLPYLFALAMGANLGSVATLNGNPQNMMIASLAGHHLPFAAYALVGLPLAAGLIVLAAWMLCRLFHAQLAGISIEPSHLPRPAFDRRLTAKALAALGIFVILSLLKVPLAAAAALASALLLVVARRPVKPVLGHIDWSLLVLFASMFVATHVLMATPAFHHHLQQAIAWASGDGWRGFAALATFVLLGSVAVSNVPLVMLVAPWLATVVEPGWRWTLIAVVATLAGNLTIFASVANMLVFEGAGPRGDLRFAQYMRVSVPVTLVTLALAVAYLYALHAVGVLAALGIR